MRSPLFALIKKDLKGYFDQPAAYILIVPFVAALSLVFFGQALLAGEASLRPLFTVDFEIQNPSLPWLLAIFVPAATMRLLAEENRDGTLELLLTHPIRAWTVLLSKFLSGFAFVAFAIFATLGIPVAVMTAGDLDVGAAAGQYLSSLLLAAAFVSIGLFTSSLTRNQIVAFILGLLVTMLLMVMGLDIVAVTLPQWAASPLQDLSPVTHFSSIARGVVHLRDVLYFVALVSTFLSATFLITRGRTLSHSSPQYRNLQLGTVGLIVFSVLIGWSGSSIAGRLDLTEDRLFTLSPATASVLARLDDVLTVEFFESREPPVQIAAAARDVGDFLEDFEAASGGKVKLVRRYPEDDPDETRKAQNAGVAPRQFNVQSQGRLEITSGYSGMALTYVDQRLTLPFIAGFDGFEYRLASLAYRMLEDEKKTVAFLTGHGELSPSAGYAAFAGLLSDTYEVTEIDASESAAIDLSGVDVLVIAGPSAAIADETESAVREYVMAGGKAMVLIESSTIDRSRLVAVPNRNSFARFPAEFGVIVEDDLVFDRQSNETLSFSSAQGSVFIPYPFWARARVVDSTVGGGIQSALMAWASSIGVAESARDRVDVLPVIESSEFAAIDFEYGDVRPNAPIFNEVQPGNLVQSLMGVAISQRERAEGQPGFRLFVAGDADWLSDSIVARAQGNIFLGLNMVDWLAQEDILADVRKKVVTSRALLFSSPTHENVARWANVAGVPALLIALGLARAMRRRRFGFFRYGQSVRAPRLRLGGRRRRERERGDDEEDAE